MNEHFTDWAVPAGELSRHWQRKLCQSVSTGPLDHDEIMFISPGYKRFTATPLGAKTSKLGVPLDRASATVGWLLGVGGGGGYQSVDYRFIASN